MDATKFDAMTEAIGAAASRRGMIGALAGGTLALVGLSALAEELAIEKKNKGDGDTCKRDGDCGQGLYCKEIKKKKNGKKKIRHECRYKDGCGKKKNFCDSSNDCCGGLRCNKDKNRCEKK